MLITTYSLGWIYIDDKKTQRFIQKKFEDEPYKRRMQNTNFWCMLKIVLVSKARKFDNSLREKVVKINCVGV